MKRAQGRPTVTWSPLALKRAPLGTGVALIAALLGRRLLSRGASRPGGPRPDLLRRRQADDRFRLRSGDAAAIVRQPDGKIVAVGDTARHGGFDFALARYNPNGSLDTSFSGDGKQTTDFGSAETGDRGGAPGRRQDRRGRLRGRQLRLRPRPLQPQRLARHDLLRRRQADDRLRRRHDQAKAVAIQADGKIVVVGTGGPRRLRARPLQLQRLARYDLLRRRQADDRLRGLRRGDGVAIQADGKIVVVGATAAWQ